MIIGGWKAYFGIESNCKATHVWLWDKMKLLFEALTTSIILYGCGV